MFSLAALMLALATFGRGASNSRQAMLSFCFIYFLGSLLFRFLKIGNAVGFDAYLGILSLLSFAQIFLYGCIKWNKGIMIAAYCEIILISLYFLSFMRIPFFVSNQLALWTTANTLAAGSLIWSWAGGKLAEPATGHTALWRAVADYCLPDTRTVSVTQKNMAILPEGKA